MFALPRNDTPTNLLTAALFIAVLVFWTALLGMDHSAPGPAGLPVVVTLRPLEAEAVASTAVAVPPAPPVLAAAPALVPKPASAPQARAAEPPASEAPANAAAASAARPSEHPQEREVVQPPVREQTQRPQPPIVIGQSLRPPDTAAKTQVEGVSGKNTLDGGARAHREPARE